MRKPKPFTIYNYMNLPDGSKLLMSKIENAGTPERIISVYISQEQHQEFNDKAMQNASKMMSPYYDNNGVFCPDGYDVT